MNEAKKLLIEAGLDKSHWGRRIIKAEATGRFTVGDESHAGDWVTCACGKLGDGIDRDDIRKPLDGVLTNLGSHFSGYVGAYSYVSAAQCLIDIEHRAVEVLKDQANVNN
jgi:hypothetical protein